MSQRHYQFYCDICHYKRITNGSDVDDLREVPKSPIPRGVPYLDPFTKKIVTPPAAKPKKKFKCPNCGYVIVAKVIKFTEPEITTDGQEDLPAGS